MDNHSDNLQGDHRAPPPCIKPSPVGQLLYIPAVPASPREQQYNYFPTTSAEDGENSTTKKLYRRITNGYHRVRNHVNMGQEFSELMKGKLRLGARIVQKGGRENLFKDVFGVNEGEELLKASQCYLLTTKGPIVGILFISTQKVTFCSDRPVILHHGDLTKQLYKETYQLSMTLSTKQEQVVLILQVWILKKKIKEVNDKKVGNPSQEYIQIVTDDSFEYWFMGFVRYEKALHNLRKELAFNSN